jgi:hypothetical protein
MATFKKGDRVKRIRSYPERDLSSMVPLCSTGTFVCVSGVNPGSGRRWVSVLWDHGIEYDVYDYTLAPLTPPQSETDQWAASKLDQLKKLVREPLPLDKQQTEEIHGGRA